jgi:biotin-dependent carboxylase-like uncharacterized protein
MIEIVESGLRSTVQDPGRLAHLRSAVPPAGPADAFAFAAAQALVGNDPADAAIEVVGLPFVLRLADARVLAVTGRDVRVRTRWRLPGWTAVLARAGEEVRVEGSERTRYAYVAIAGGIASATVLGSRATYLPAAIGPWPRALRTGDRLPLGPPGAGSARAGARIAPPAENGPIRAMAGPHREWFDDAAMRAFFAEPFEVLAQSDRMGVRLRGPEIRPHAGEILSCGLAAGAVQVPRGGAPIALLADHQTTGGYPVIAVVARADIGRVAQAVPGERLRFALIDVAAAVEALRAGAAALASLG